jgi:hypothetical protein
MARQVRRERGWWVSAFGRAERRHHCWPRTEAELAATYRSTHSARLASPLRAHSLERTRAVL